MSNLPTLTDDTFIRPIAGGAFLAVAEGTAPATLIAAAATRPCNWLVEIYTEDGVGVVNCGAASIEFANGWACTSGHSHVSFAQYFDDEELDGMRQAHVLAPAGARRMDGALVR